MRRIDRQVTKNEELEEIIKSCRTCHVAMVEEAGPYIVPLNFGYEYRDGRLTLYFHSAKEGKKLDILRKNGRVCFDMVCEGESIPAEKPCGFGLAYSSIIGTGNVEFVEDPAEKCRALSLLMKHQSGQDVGFGGGQAAGVCIYKICTMDFTGKSRRPSE